MLNSYSAHATAPDDAPVSSDTGSSSSGYVQTARQLAESAASSFNSQDSAASQGATSGIAQGGIYGNSGTAISQFQRQFDSANTLVGKLTTALSGCLDAANAEIAQAQADLAAAQAEASAPCSSSSSDSGSSNSGCSSAHAEAEAKMAAAQAKIDQANKNKAACHSYINPLISQGNQAAADVRTAAVNAGFTLNASHGSTAAINIVKKTPTQPGAVDPQVYVPAAKQIDTSSLQFWSGDGGYSTNGVLKTLPNQTQTQVAENSYYRGFVLRPDGTKQYTGITYMGAGTGLVAPLLKGGTSVGDSVPRTGLNLEFLQGK